MPDIKPIVLPESDSPPRVCVKFGTTELVTYRVTLAKSADAFGEEVGAGDNIQFNEADCFDLNIPAKDLKGAYLDTNAIFEAPGGGTVDSYYAEISISVDGKDVVGSPVIWTGALNGKSHDSLLFPIKFT